MKGLVIVAFKRTPGAYIDYETPEGFYESTNFVNEDLMNIYGLHRMRRMDPNFLTLTLKKQKIASFYSGFNFKHYVGKPGYSVTLFCDEDENPNVYEDQLRQIAHELLPKRNEEDQGTFKDEFGTEKTFQELLNEYFVDLQGDLLEGVDESVEVKEEGAGFLSKISDNGSKKATAGGTGGASAWDGGSSTEQASSGLMTEEEIANEFKAIEEKALEDQVTYLKGELEARENELYQLKEQLAGATEKDAKISQLQNELDIWKTKVAELMEDKQIAEESIKRMTEFDMQNAEEMQRQARTIKKLRHTVEKLKEKLAEESSGEVEDDVAAVEEEGADHVETTSRIVKLEREIASLKEVNAELRKNLEDLQEENSELHQLVADLELTREKYEDLVQEIDTGKKKQSELEDELASKESEIEELNAKIKELRDKISERVGVTRSEADEEEMENLRGNIAKLTERVGVLEEELASKEETVENLKQEIIEYKVQNKLHRREIEMLKRRVES
ncbi:MAG: hypothetical protein ACTSU5_12605 [Promethearchaeota archaeon]